MAQKIMRRIIVSFLCIFFIVPTVYFLYSVWKVINQEVNQKRTYKYLKHIKEAQSNFKLKNGKYGSLIELRGAGLISVEDANAFNNGYKFELKVEKDRYVVTATPVRVGTFATGHISYFLNESGEIHGDRKHGLEATLEDPLLPDP